MNPITLDAFQEKLTVLSPALFTEVLQQTRMPPFWQKYMQAWDAGSFAVLRSPATGWASTLATITTSAP